MPSVARTSLADLILFFHDFSLKVPPKNIERVSPLIYLADPSGLWRFCDRAAASAHIGIPLSSPSSYRGSSPRVEDSHLGFGLRLL